ALLSRFPMGYISVVGQRAFESFQRARLPRVSVSKWVTKDIVVAPIQDWTALEVWGYILMRGLPYNKAYEYGFDRLGCVICPANELAEFEVVRERYPGIYGRLHQVLEDVVRRQGLPRDVIDYGLWRWRRGIPGDIRRYVKISLNVKYPVRLREDGESLVVDLERPMNKSTFLEFLKMLGNVEADGDYLIIRGKLGEAKVRVESVNSVFVSSPSREMRIEIAGLASRASICGECNLCINWCPTKALKRVGPGPSFIVDDSKCINCMLCSRACPSAQYLVFRNPDLRSTK
ncbi:MAG: phosphoadenosine phosphosulfate reductase family protein, partial [Vulcanisaeta sp.]